MYSVLAKLIAELFALSASESRDADAELAQLYRIIRACHDLRARIRFGAGGKDDAGGT